MKIKAGKLIAGLVLLIVGVTLWLVLDTEQKVNLKTVSTQQSASINDHDQPAAQHRSIASWNAQSSADVSGADEIIEISFIDTQLSDDNWEDDEFIERQMLALEMMSEDMLNEELGDDRKNAKTIAQLAEFFMGYDQEFSRLLDLDCAKTACRVTVQFADQQGQDEVLNALKAEMDWLKKGYVELKVFPDESRLAALYLIRKT